MDLYTFLANFPEFHGLDENIVRGCFQEAEASIDANSYSPFLRSRAIFLLAAHKITVRMMQLSDNLSDKGNSQSKDWKYGKYETRYSRELSAIRSSRGEFKGFVV
jgi:hypothetical protein